MGTKNEPGPFDCHGKAEPDEPIFTLRGKDRHAPMLIRLWAAMRAAGQEDPEVVEEALRCADAMDRWRESKDLRQPDEKLEKAVNALCVLIARYGAK